ncbi:protein of unknown function [Thermoactinomyces sp. DSM 45891]|uniref:DUF4397 domain-containing protein n=1 Tax=Thermoactinomyces sp. DSM 45891 TaxID=1761907 RepID=UPI0009133D39|nr:DUF4397 domain-containing protein [Thermoactinomyces sp. DSM 45891]SFX19896.1 protein of unknown function [Thermoactinomyces sp. DSM 45891]
MGKKKRSSRSSNGKQMTTSPSSRSASKPLAGIAGVRILHAATRWQEDMDVYLDGKRMVRRLPYGAMTNYVSIHSGDSYLQMTRNQTEGTVVSQILSVRNGRLCTLALIDSEDVSKKNPKLITIPDHTESQEEEMGQIRFIHLHSQGSNVDLVANNRVIFNNIPFTHLTPYVPIQPKRLELKVQVTGMMNTDHESITLPLFSKDVVTVFYLGDVEQGDRLILVHDR